MDSFYLKFPSVLKKALQDKNVEFPLDLLVTYEKFIAYRGIIREINDDTPINRNDFASYIELGKKVRGKNISVKDINNYSCSLFIGIEELELAMHLPKPNKKIVKGFVKSEYGPQVTNGESKHVHWWLFDTNELYSDFKVI